MAQDRNIPPQRNGTEQRLDVLIAQMDEMTDLLKQLIAGQASQEIELREPAKPKRSKKAEPDDVQLRPDN